jgi:hypothetical protein
MFSKTLPLLALPAAVIALAGCGSSTSQSAPAAGTTASAGTVTTAVGAYTAKELHDALLTEINGAAPAIAPEDGQYGSLPEIKSTKDSMKGVAVSPASCESATLTGFNATTFADTPAAVTTFRVGRNGVSEVLMSPSSAAAASALGRSIPSGCASYHATISGKTYSYQVQESSVSGIGTEAKALNVKAVGYPQVDVWSLVYRGSGLVGAITVVGPDASEAAVRQLSQQAYKYATTKLS